MFFQEVKYVINAVGCSEKYYFLEKKKSKNVYVQIVPVSCNDSHVLTGVKKMYMFAF